MMILMKILTGLCIIISLFELAVIIFVIYTLIDMRCTERMVEKYMLEMKKNKE